MDEGSRRAKMEVENHGIVIVMPSPPRTPGREQLYTVLQFQSNAGKTSRWDGTIFMKAIAQLKIGRPKKKECSERRSAM